MGNFDVKINIPVTNNTLTEILIALLSDYGFEGFIEEDTQLRAFISDNKATKNEIADVISDLPVEEKLSFEVSKLEEKNWNEEWEKNFFQPIRIGDKCLIRSSFHPVQRKAEYEILVDPKMSFGTGHHATTYLMIEELLETDLQNKVVLDMGCGTGILAILAAMRGSSDLTAIDIDEWAYNNTKENIAINNVDGIKVLLGGAEKLGNRQFDVIIANINRNILLEDMKYYSRVLKSGGKILFSGFYLSDLDIIKEEAEKNNLVYHHHHTKSDWTMAVFYKA
ncbi:50S ribosomal protein L11 methyltransferase [Saccharicrinis sp. FJH2]|uniref:50S ribosomal protein L11 methyltransferase n=1 Tax=Saccharicrinis sp. FJH65 TaxID=3344659 RepID=UPI0035F29632